MHICVFRLLGDKCVGHVNGMHACMHAQVFQQIVCGSGFADLSIVIGEA